MFFKKKPGSARDFKLLHETLCKIVPDAEPTLTYAGQTLRMYASPRSVLGVRFVRGTWIGNWFPVDEGSGKIREDWISLASADASTRRLAADPTDLTQVIHGALEMIIDSCRGTIALNESPAAVGRAEKILAAAEEWIRIGEVGS